MSAVDTVTAVSAETARAQNARATMRRVLPHVVGTGAHAPRAARRTEDKTVIATRAATAEPLARAMRDHLAATHARHATTTTQSPNPRSAAHRSRRPAKPLKTAACACPS